MTGFGSSGAAAARQNRAQADFDQPHLARYTLDNRDLEKEIIGLFLQQLPQIVAHLRTAPSQSDWKMAAHTLKGSAAAVGAVAIHASAMHLEQMPYDVDVNVKSETLSALDQDVARFHRIVTSIYGPF